MQYGENAAEFHNVYPVKEETDIADAYLRSIGDTYFGLQMRTWARTTAKVSSDAYLYYFTHVPPLPNADYLGAFHAAEIAYAFNNNGKSNDYTDEVNMRLADQISNYWVNFARSGNPNGNDLPNWTPYSEGYGDYMELGTELKAGQYVIKEQLDFLENAQK
jgi:para-nitrobenzyl esterase